MKNILLYTILVIMIISCRQEEDEAILGRPEERTEKILQDYRQQLAGSAYGWKAFVFPGAGGGYSFLFEFNEEGRVTMMADINSECATKSSESSFRLEAVQRPSLFFDTYSYLHMLSDPAPDTIGGSLGQGLLSDFEFAFEATHGDTIVLKGNQHDTPMILIKATQAEAQAYKAGVLNTVMTKISAYAKINPFVYLQANDGKRINASFNLQEKKFSLSYKQADSLAIITSPFGFSQKGIFLQKPVGYKSVVFQEIFYDDAGQVFYVVVNGTRIDLRSSAEPVLPLHLLLGVDFSALYIPSQQLEGWSPTFITTRQNVASALEDYKLTLKYIELDFHTDNNTVNFNFIVQSYSNGYYYLVQYPYTYTKSADGVFKFAAYDEPNANGKYLAAAVEPLLFYFNKFRFRMDYLSTASGYLAQMKCVESPSFYFSGDF